MGPLTLAAAPNPLANWRSLAPLTRLLVVLFCLLSIALYAYGIDADFVFGHDGWCAGRRAIGGTNLVRYGYFGTRFAHVRNLDVAAPKDFILYWHHPHGMPLLVGLSFKLFGRGEWQTRLIPFLSMMLSLAMWWGITWRVVLSNVARATSMLLFVSLPMLVIYGVFVNMDPLVLLACIASTWAYLRFDEEPSKGRGLTCFAVALVASYSGWDWFLFAALLCGVEAGSWIARRKFRLSWLALHSCGTLLGFFAIVSHLVMLEGSKDPRDSFRHLFMSRAGGASHMTFWGALKAQGGSMIELFTPGMLAVGALGLLVVVVSLLRLRFERRQGIALVFLATGIGFVAIFAQGASVHDFWSSIAAPYFPMIAADMVARIERVLTRPRLLHAWRAAWALGMGFSLFVNLSEIIARREHPDPGHIVAGMDHHHREVAAWKWLHEHTPSGEQWLIDRRAAEYGVAAQRTFYTDRTERQMDFARAPLSNDEKAAYALLDTRRFPSEYLAKTLQAWIANYRLTVIDAIVIAHLREPSSTPKVTYLRSEPELTFPGVSWLRTGHRAAQRLVDDDLLKAEFFLYAGLPEEAGKAYAARKISQPSEQDVVRLRHKVVEHNFELLAGRTPKPVETWLPELLPSCQPVKAPLRAIRTESVNRRSLRATAVIDAWVGDQPFVQGFNVNPGKHVRAGMLSRELLVVPMPSQVLPPRGLLFFDAAASLRHGKRFDDPAVSLGQRQHGQRPSRKYPVPCDDSRSRWWRL